MTEVQAHYEAFPYPERNPQDEHKRLITGSPSNPIEIDHFLFDGQRDWSQPFHALFAGGGTGDGLIQLAALLEGEGCPHEITYIDLSAASRKIAEARARERGISSIRFVTGSLLDAPGLGTFDYIDCCGVLHHLPDPDAGFDALRHALRPGGGMGFMVYAPYGRSGVYPLQEAFAQLLAGLSPKERLKRARKIIATLPESHPFRVNRNLGDHTLGDAGFYDLLLHSQDRAYTIRELNETLTRTGWHFVGPTLPGLYDLAAFTGAAPGDLSALDQMAIAEQLRGTLKTHVGYAVPADAARSPARGFGARRVPHIRQVAAPALAQAIAKGHSPTLTLDTTKATLSLPRESAPLIAAINGRRSLGEIAARAGTDPLTATALWAKIEAQLTPWGLLHFSNFPPQRTEPGAPNP